MPGRAEPSREKRSPTTREHLRLLARLVRADGCSDAPDFWFTDCCDEHDVYYRTGHDADGRPIARAEADRRLRACMRKTARTPIGRYVLAPLYWLAVRIFGATSWKG